MKKFVTIVLLVMLLFTNSSLSSAAEPVQPTQETEIEQIKTHVANLHLQIMDLQREIMLLKWRLSGIYVVDGPHIQLGNYIIIHQGQVWMQQGNGLYRFPEFDTPNELIGPKAMLPLRPLAQMLGHQVTWDNDSKIAHVTNRWSKEFYAAFTVGQQGVVLGENNRIYIPLKLALGTGWEHGRIDMAFIDPSGTIFIRISALG